MVALTVGTYQHYKAKIQNSDFDAKTQLILTRALPVQWVNGDANKAESSFFKINSQGTPLDDIEEALLKYRQRPIAISARAIIRAGKGNKYWSAFIPEKASRIEVLSKGLHKTLFDPEVSAPIKTLDLPLGGSKGIRAALQILIEYLGIACITQSHKVVTVDYSEDNKSGDLTIEVLKKAQKLSDRLTGNEKGSLGLHPAIYFYGPSGVHSSALFLGTAKFISGKITNNDAEFFKHFSLIRSKIEECLINNKELIATILQKLGSKRRVDSYTSLISKIYKSIKEGSVVTGEDLINWAGLTGKVGLTGKDVVGNESNANSSFHDDIKSKIFINMALNNSVKCPICGGYLDAAKSVSYDHKVRKRDGGLGNADNGQMVHPYCNQSVKN